MQLKNTASHFISLTIHRNIYGHKITILAINIQFTSSKSFLALEIF